MDGSTGKTPKERLGNAKKAKQASKMSSPIPSPLPSSTQTRTPPHPSIRKVKAEGNGRKADSAPKPVEEKQNSKKRSSSAKEPQSWKRVKLAENLQFKEAGFFMLEELNFDPNDPTDAYGQLMLQIPKNPQNLEFEPIVDTNDSDLDELLASDDDEPAPKPVSKTESKVEASKAAKKAKKVSSASPASPAQASAPKTTKTNDVVESPSDEMDVDSVKSSDEPQSSESEEDVIPNLDEDTGGDETLIDALDDNEDEQRDKDENKLRSRHVFVPQEELDFVDLPEWLKTYDIHKRILMALRDMGYTEPTPIQTAVMPVALGKRLDIVGASQTGSGKTLAFGIPVIHQILELQEKAHRLGVPNDDTLKCLILSPTRELAVQIVSHLEKISKHAYIKISPMIGGLSVTKQMRLLRKRPDILVATPGRLWELISSGLFEESGQSMASLRWLIFDEADKMIELGRFAELSNILRTVYNSRGSAVGGKLAEEMDVDKKKGSEPKKLQTFVFSATMMVGEEERKNLKKVKGGVEKLKEKLRREKLAKMKRRKGGDTGDGQSSMMEKLMDQINFEREVEIVDIVKGEHKVANLEEAKICCLHEEKDYYLYYFLSKYGGKTIVFVNAISNIKRLLPLMVLLRVNAFGMHANMEQHHRMKNLEKFVNSERSVLITTDVLSRGVDLPAIDHVIHYSIPTSSEIFIHRSGRTARAFASGLSLHIVDPEDRQRYNTIMQQLGRIDRPDHVTASGEEHTSLEVPDFPVSDFPLFKACKERVKLAAQLDSLSHENQKKSAEKQWLVQKAKDLDADIPDDLLSDDELDSKQPNDAYIKQKAYQNAQKKQKYAVLKAKLRELLSKPLTVDSASSSTSTSEPNSQGDHAAGKTQKPQGKQSETKATSKSKTSKSPASSPATASKPSTKAQNHQSQDQKKTSQAKPHASSHLVSLASSAYPTKMAGAKLLFAKNSPSFQSPPVVADKSGEMTASKKAKLADNPSSKQPSSAANAASDATNEDLDEDMPNLIPVLSSQTFQMKKAPSAAFLDVQKTKNTKEAHYSSEMIRKQKEKRKLRMAAMGRQSQSVRGPHRNGK